MFFTERYFGLTRVEKKVSGSDDKWRKFHTEELHNTNCVVAFGSITADRYLRNNLRPSFTLLNTTYTHKKAINK